MNVCIFVEPPQPCVVLYGKRPALSYCAKCLGVSVESLKKLLEKKREIMKGKETKIIARIYFRHAELCDCPECRKKRQKKEAKP
jgi:hypothetical protein